MNTSLQSLFRDLRTAHGVQFLLELGYYETEFTFYGCAYLENGKVYYKISEDAEDIYNFVESAALRNIYPSNVMQFTQKYAVPSGMKEIISKELKKELAKQLRSHYPKAFFESLYALAEKRKTNEAASELWAEADLLDGLFEANKMNDFEQLVEYCYTEGSLTDGEYHNLCAWIAAERASMQDDSASKDAKEKTFYGIGYYDAQGNLKHMIDTKKSQIFEATVRLEKEGCIISPIYEEILWYKIGETITVARERFEEIIKQKFDEAYMNRIKAFRSLAQPIDPSEFRALCEQAQAQWGDNARETMLHYGRVWGILS